MANSANGASWRLAGPSNGIDAATGAARELVARMEEGQQVALCWRVVCRLVTLNCPLPFSIVKPSEVVGAGIPGHGHARRHEIRNGYRQKEKDDGDTDQKAFRCPRHNYLFRRKDFRICAYWPTNAELLATTLIMS